MSINVICMDRFIRGVGSKRGQGDQDGVEVPRRIDDVERKNIYIYSLYIYFDVYINCLGRDGKNNTSKYNQQPPPRKMPGVAT